jgi:hypothetical protein
MKCLWENPSRMCIPTYINTYIHTCTMYIDMSVRPALPLMVPYEFPHKDFIGNRPFRANTPPPITPCEQATPETTVSGVTCKQGKRPAAVFCPFGRPTPYAYNSRSDS